jgi:hypothetical protein
MAQYYSDDIEPVIRRFQRDKKLRVAAALLVLVGAALVGLLFAQSNVGHFLPYR